MRNFIRGIVNNIIRFSERLGDYSLIIDKTWYLVLEKQEIRITYIFRSKNNEMLISRNGNIEKGKWEYIKASKCLLLETNMISKLYHVVYVRDNYLIFQNDFDQIPFIFINEIYFQSRLSNIGERILDYVLAEINTPDFSYLKVHKENMNFDYRIDLWAENSKVNNTTKSKNLNIKLETLDKEDEKKVQFEKETNGETNISSNDLTKTSSLDNRINRMDEIIRNLQKHVKK